MAWGQPGWSERSNAFGTGICCQLLAPLVPSQEGPQPRRAMISTRSHLQLQALPAVLVVPAARREPLRVEASALRRKGQIAYLHTALNAVVVEERFTQAG